MLLTASGLGCGASTDEGKLPPDVQDPATLHTPAGALARYRGALTLLPVALDWYATETGILTDELADLPAPLGGGGTYTNVDSRRGLSSFFDDDYGRLHKLRAQAREARGFLQAYAPDSSPALSGHLYAIEGYAEVLLADLFCSGIPLSTVDFNGDYTLAAGSSTEDVYAHAIALFDTALTLVSDSGQFQSLAAVGRGRALLALGRYTDAAAAVATVPDDYTYQVVFTPTAPYGPSGRLLSSFLQGPDSYTEVAATPSVGDNEGGNGLNYRSSGDPRIPVTDKGPDILQHTLYFPAKYPEAGSVTLVVADGIEARLIEAEAALQAGDATTWLTKLNVLRETAALPDTTDPGTAVARVDLLFRERAFWLYLTGHRQGDLRRLVREYRRASTAVYPTGSYEGGSGSYGTEIVAPVPASERDLNPKYTGCIHLDA